MSLSSNNEKHSRNVKVTLGLCIEAEDFTIVHLSKCKTFMTVRTRSAEFPNSYSDFRLYQATKYIATYTWL